MYNTIDIPATDGQASLVNRMKLWQTRKFPKTVWNFQCLKHTVLGDYVTCCIPGRLDFTIPVIYGHIVVKCLFLHQIVIECRPLLAFYV